MNKAKLKSYAPQARKDFIAAVTARANLLGLSVNGDQLEVAPAQTQGDVTLIAGLAWPAKVNGQREQLIARIRKDGFAHTLEAIAYTWFNRFAALRYMELHDYLGHGHRALSSTAGGLPDILTHAAELAQGSNLPGLRAALVLELKLAGNRDGELYRLLLVAQCNALSTAMPFLFERIDDDSELLLPDNLLRSDSVIAKLVEAIPEEDWAEVEIIGWLYQFYISEKKDQVIGKVVKSEDIPAATQLFTPNWIVQYLVQNSVGRLWLMANPHSTLSSEWPYYITPAEQTPEVQAQLDALIQTRMDEDGGSSLNPETITVLDPACGSGHILVVAYDVLKAIYLERGYQARAIPRLILEKNLFGLDIDDRAAQMAGFALLMKARADDRRLFNEPLQLNVLSLQESKGLDAATLANALYPEAAQTVAPLVIAGFEEENNDLFPATRAQMRLGEGLGVPLTHQDAARLATAELRTLQQLIATFVHAKTFGSLIQVAPALNAQLATLTAHLQQALQNGDLYAKAAAQDLWPLVAQARVLGMQFDAVVANPPYMGGKGMNPALKEYAKATFPDSKSDLFAMFMERGFEWCKPSGFNSMVTMQSWMFLSSYEAMREELLQKRTIQTMAHLGSKAFGEISGEIVQTTAFVLQGQHFSGFKPTFFRLVDGVESEKEIALRSRLNRFDKTVQDDFRKIPGSPVAYWPSASMRTTFRAHKSLSEVARPREGLNTTDNDRFLRRWWECSLLATKFDTHSAEDLSASKAKWVPCQKGGGYRKWFGNNEYVVNWKDNGREIKSVVVAQYGSASKRVVNEHLYFKEGITWSSISSSMLAMRFVPSGHIFETKGNMCFFKTEKDLLKGIGFLNSCLVNPMIQCVSPTIDFHAGPVGKLPIADNVSASAIVVAKRAIFATTADWSSFERSWNFKYPPILNEIIESAPSLQSSYKAWITKNRDTIAEMKRIEEENNQLFIDAYGLTDEFTAKVPLQQITLTVNPAYRYGGQLSEEERWLRFQRHTVEELISYAIGCMMGRYSLDEPGLIYAHAGNVGFDPSRYDKSFPADADGIVPITDELWFADDAPSRIREFLNCVWGPDTLEENMAWLAESLGNKASETPDETIRRYLADKFYKDHLQTYKKRPIYWHFSSGKQGAFQALVYLHRYNESTLARLRAEYVVPLTGKIQGRIDMLQKDAAAASSTPARNKLAKEVEKLKKKHLELLAYDAQLRHHADLRITLDLDDGVKVNYGKFGDLLAEVKAVTGGAGDE